MIRILPAFLGLGLATLWVVGLSVDATVWLTWAAGIAATLALAAVGLVPERHSSLVAGAALGLIALALAGLWVVGLATHATPWLTWWTFVAACLAALDKPRDAVRRHAEQFNWPAATRQFEQALAPRRAVAPPMPLQPAAVASTS